MQSKHLWTPFPYIGSLEARRIVFSKRAWPSPLPHPLSTSAPARQGLESFVAHHYSIRKSHSHEGEQEARDALPCDLKAPHAESRNSMRSTKDPQDKTVQVATAPEATAAEKRFSPQDILFTLFIKFSIRNNAPHLCGFILKPDPVLTKGSNLISPNLHSSPSALGGTHCTFLL